MRKIVLLLAVSLFSLQGVYAQGSSNVNHLNLCVGALYERGLDATLSYEHETKYHHSWEYFANAYIQYDTDPEAGHITKESFWHNYFTYNLGIAYKPCVIASLGSDTEKVIGAGHIGFEHSYDFRRGWSLFWQVKEDIVLRGEDLFRTGVTVGVKFPL